jgi:nucleotidyltransferase substrate binding protein (TIGR01987 family)
MSDDNQTHRWKQRFSSYQKAFTQLRDAATLRQQRPLSPLEQQGLVKAFEFTHELAWNVMKDYFEYQGTTGLTGSRDAIREAFRRGLVEDGTAWMDTIASRNRTSHTYDEPTVLLIIEDIVSRYLPLFDHFQARMEVLAREQ